jgi:electron transfer flavoprotein alpha subunit/electron transfer flavoprotein alpha/beta subunit
MPFSIVVCGTLVPDPLQTLEPVTSPGGPALKNEMMLPAVLDPWASHALYEAASLAAQNAGSKVWLVSLGPKAKLQQVMMTVGQKVPFELVAVDGPASGFSDSFETAAALAEAIGGIAGLDRANMLLFGGWESASRGAGSTLQMVGERLGITERFLGVDRLTVQPDGSLEVLERIEGGQHLVSVVQAPPAVFGWATGYLPEPRNNPQVGMANMRGIMPALQKAKAAALKSGGLCYQTVSLPKQQRETRIVKNAPVEEIAREIVAWISEDTVAQASSLPCPDSSGHSSDPTLVLAHTEPDGTLAKPALEVLSAALSLSTNVTLGVVGSAPSSLPSQVKRVLCVEGEAFTQSRAATDAAAAEAICRAFGAGVILASHTSRWARALPGVAARLDGRIDTHATGIGIVNGVVAVTRWFYRQRMEGVLTRSQRPWMVLLDPGCSVPWTGETGNVAAEKLAADIAPRSNVTGIRAPQADEQTIRPDAKLLFVAGAGWTKKQADGGVHGETAEKLIHGFLRASQASLGGSKSLVDMGGEGQALLKCMTHLNQIGQTGSTPRHPKGLSTCCHGEEPHVVGWRFIMERRAVNLDANCGWARGKADVLYVADAFAVMAEVNRLLGA